MFQKLSNKNSKENYERIKQKIKNKNQKKIENLNKKK